jgi:hypothetical protein
VIGTQKPNELLSASCLRLASSGTESTVRTWFRPNSSAIAVVDQQQSHDPRVVDSAEAFDTTRRGWYSPAPPFSTAEGVSVLSAPGVAR